MKTIKPEDRYQYLINARNFHYDNFNKWLTYFYIATAALFVAYYSIPDSDSGEPSIEKLGVLILGYVTSLSWYWSSKGYYYWNINFITLVNDCEKELPKEKRVYSVFANKGTQNNYWCPIMGANISTSKIAILLAFVITIFWGWLFLNKIVTFEFCCQGFFLFLFSIILTLILSWFVPKYFLKSKIDHFPNLRIKQDSIEE